MSKISNKEKEGEAEQDKEKPQEEMNASARLHQFLFRDGPNNISQNNLKRDTSRNRRVVTATDVLADPVMPPIMVSHFDPRPQAE